MLTLDFSFKFSSAVFNCFSSIAMCNLQLLLCPCKSVTPRLLPKERRIFSSSLFKQSSVEKFLTAFLQSSEKSLLLLFCSSHIVFNFISSPQDKSSIISRMVFLEKEICEFIFSTKTINCCRDKILFFILLLAYCPVRIITVATRNSALIFSIHFTYPYDFFYLARNIRQKHRFTIYPALKKCFELGFIFQFLNT